MVEEMELLLEGYLGEFHEIELQLTSMLNQIVDAREFTNTHQVFLTLFTLFLFCILNYVLLICFLEWHQKSNHPNETADGRHSLWSDLCNLHFLNLWDEPWFWIVRGPSRILLDSLPSVRFYLLPRCFGKFQIWTNHKIGRGGGRRPLTRNYI